MTKGNNSAATLIPVNVLQKLCFFINIGTSCVSNCCLSSDATGLISNWKIDHRYIDQMWYQEIYIYLRNTRGIPPLMAFLLLKIASLLQIKQEYFLDFVISCIQALIHQYLYSPRFKYASKCSALWTFQIQTSTNILHFVPPWNSIFFEKLSD